MVLPPLSGRVFIPFPGGRPLPPARATYSRWAMTRQIAVVTGASRGIGRALVERLRQRGHAVVAIAGSSGDLADVAAQTGALPYALDVADPIAVEEVFTRILSEVGVPDCS
jgi:NAD(P)-dependent dehydrogenase (short-subunit alcohol dehydrogenase family)